MTVGGNGGGDWPPRVRGLANLAHRAYRGERPDDLLAEITAQLSANSKDAGAWFDLGILHELVFDKPKGLTCQARALELDRAFHVATPATEPRLKLLMFCAPGDIATNIPVTFLLMDTNVALDFVFLQPGQPLPSIPDHDLALIGVCQSDANAPYLEQLDTVLESWPRPVLLHPSGIRSMERDRLWRLLAGTPGICMPPTLLLNRADCAALADGIVAELPAAASFPCLLRPVDSHGGHGLERLERAADVASYLDRYASETFFWVPFIDYSSEDGTFRKYRVVLIEGKPFLCHMAVGDHWMVHYLNTGMEQSESKRALEAEAFATFDNGFAKRHAAGLRALYERTASSYITIDCAETNTGELLIFEAGTAMVVHDMDSPQLFPYKQAPMRRVFEAFRAMLERHRASE